MPPARTPFERWLRSVALAGQGRYSEAAELVRTLREPRHPVALRSTALSLEGSILRQQGDHANALRLDARALSLVDEERDEQSPELALARCDALTGLAADHLGLGEFDRAEPPLARAKGFLAAAEPAPFGWRARVRWTWVNTETAIATGNRGRAVGFGLVETRSFIGKTVPSLRHRVKSHLILAATHFCLDDLSQSQICAREVLGEATDAGLLPLAWAAAMLLHAALPDEGWDERAAALRGQWT
ncbi:MAG: tetratricopeptide repeat protein [Segniliparus sp.]|uniref:tetratricopeptide repeat protein n=1 Tax=Segniliparus sp. TaxID=2804064 RepID=UPI003F3E410E